MEAVDRIPAPVTAALDTETGIITFHCPGFNDSSTSSDLVNCSQLLTDLLTNSSTDAGEESVHLPVTWESLQLWLRYASKPNCQQFDKASSSDVGAGDALVVNEEAHSATIQPGLFKEDRSSSIGTSIPIETLCTLLNVRIAEYDSCYLSSSCPRPVVYHCGALCMNSTCTTCTRVA